MAAAPTYLVGLLVSLLWVTVQEPARPAHVVQGDRVEESFRQFRDQLETFFFDLRSAILETRPELLEAMDSPPPEPVVYGYQLLPPIVVSEPAGSRADWEPTTRSYSWPLTQQYVSNELVRLQRARDRLQSPSAARNPATLGELLDEYRLLVSNQKIIDQHVQYNRFWQRTVAEEKQRFDRLTELYNSVISGDSDVARSVQEALGQPAVPAFLGLDGALGEVVLKMPVYTDIVDEAYLGRVERAVENAWHASEDGVVYVLDVEFRFVSTDGLYRGREAPGRGDHIDLEAHIARFPLDGALLTTGAESTHAFPGRSVLLGAGEVSTRTLAHEFGHLLGFRDGYIRGYRDLGRDGFEILELTSAFDDIMSAPGEGGVRPAHFRLIVDEIGSRSVD
jgi:hypothetical protein